jgi:hypothetical protein
MLSDLSDAIRLSKTIERRQLTRIEYEEAREEVVFDRLWGRYRPAGLGVRAAWGKGCSTEDR